METETRICMRMVPVGWVDLGRGSGCGCGGKGATKRVARVSLL